MRPVAIACTDVVLLMVRAEVIRANGTIVGAIGTVVRDGVAPLALVLDVPATPAQPRARRAAASEPSANPDHRGHASGDAFAPERKEP